MDKLLPKSATIDNGRLVIADCDTAELARRFGTPLIVFDRATFVERASAYADALGPRNTLYAGKAFCCVAICELVDRSGLGLDVCSGGELATALAAGFPPARIVFHGNNKSRAELQAANEAGVGRIVIDSFDEIERIKELEIRADVLIRVTPGVEAHTHEYVQTGQEDSKFGFGLAEGIALRAARAARSLPGCNLVGLHAHIGSQIFDVEPFEVAVARLAEFCSEMRAEDGFEIQELNVGGGVGISHNDFDDPPEISDVVTRVAAAVKEEFATRGLAEPNVIMEPGRSIVGPAAVTLYEIGTVKDIPGIRTFVSVDGGMSDNPRHALYGARYNAYLANRMDDPADRTVTIAGKHCESGDILIDEVKLPGDVSPGDLLCLPATGAYTYSMASNYNRVPRPAVVMVENGRATEIVRRETTEDLLRLDLRADGSAP